MALADHQTLEYGRLNFTWPGYATIRIGSDDGQVIYLDPGRTDYGVLTDDEPGDADYILVSHTHHYDPEAIRRVANEETIVYVLDDIVELENLGNRPKDRLTQPLDIAFAYNVKVFEYGAEFDLDGIDVKAVPAYNHPTPKGLNIRPNGKGLHEPGSCVGFHVTVDGTRVFWPSDSDFIDEHRELEVDVLFPPISRLATMDRLEAVELVEALEPDLVIPVHYMYGGKTPTAGFHIAGDPHAFKSDVDDLSIDTRCAII